MACNGRQFNSIEEDVCQLVYVERAEVFKSEDVSFCFLLSFPPDLGDLPGLFMPDRTPQEALRCFNPKPVSRSSAVSTWEGLFGGSVSFVPHLCSVSDLTLPGAAVWWVQKTWWDRSSRADPALP